MSDRALDSLKTDTLNIVSVFQLEFQKHIGTSNTVNYYLCDAKL